VYEALLIVHFLSLAAGIGLSVTLAVQAVQAKRLPPEEAGRFMAMASKAAIIAPIAILFIILSGVGLLWQHGWAADGYGVWFWIKMGLVVLLMICTGGAKINGDKGRADPSGPGIARAEMFGKGALVTSVLAVIAAVLVFG